MVLAKLWTDRIREEGRKAGCDETNQAWEAWNERRLAAEREGRPFTEPLPSRNGAADHNAR